MTDLEAPGTTKTCRICAAEMPAGAAYCTTCKHYQNDFRQFVTSLSIGALVSLISVAALAWTSVRSYLVWPHSDVESTAVKCTTGDVAFAVSNTGTRSAVIADGDITRTYPGVAQADTRKLFPAEDIVLKAGESRMVRMKMFFRGEESAMPAVPPQRCVYAAKLRVIDFDGRTRMIPQDCPCAVDQ